MFCIVWVHFHGCGSYNTARRWNYEVRFSAVHFPGVRTGGKEERRETKRKKQRVGRGQTERRTGGHATRTVH